MEKKYVVATKCVTYNHAPYILDALRGFSIQSTSFPCVFIIIDDASSDGEPEILRHWALDNLNMNEDGVTIQKEMPYGELIYARHKDRENSFFALLLLSENHYRAGKSSQKMVYIAEWYDNAKYHAICEGDDYWTDTLKLQKQVDYMESHPECSLCYTKSKRECDGKILGEWGDDDCSFEGLLNGSIIPTLTRLERVSSYLKYAEEVQPQSHGWKMWDYSNILYYSLKSEIRQLDGYSGVYRILKDSASHSSNVKKLLDFYNSADDIRIFILEKYIEDNDYKNELVNKVKINKVLYVLDQYTRRFMISEAATIYRAERDILSKKNRIKFYLETFSRVFSPIFIILFGINRFLKMFVKNIYLSI